MESVANLLHHYRQELEGTAAVALDREQHLCPLLLHELTSLEGAVAASNRSAVNGCVINQQQLFGRSFLLGNTGESAEVAFNRVSGALGHGATKPVIQADGSAAA